MDVINNADAEYVENNEYEELNTSLSTSDNVIKVITIHSND